MMSAKAHFFCCLEVKYGSLGCSIFCPDTGPFLDYEYSKDWYLLLICFPGGSDGEESACNAGDLGSIPGLGRSPREENGDPLQYSYLKNSMDRGVWWAIVYGVTKSWT